MTGPDVDTLVEQVRVTVPHYIEDSWLAPIIHRGGRHADNCPGCAIDAALTVLARLAKDGQEEAVLHDAWKRDSEAYKDRWTAEQAKRRAAEAEAQRLRERVTTLEQALWCFHDEEGWTFIEHEGKTWGYCPECGLAELWEGGIRVRQEMLAARLAAGSPSQGCPECRGADGHSLDCETGRAEIRSRLAAGSPSEQEPGE
jgi:hypothetical protein